MCCVLFNHSGSRLSKWVKKKYHIDITISQTYADVSMDTWCVQGHTCLYDHHFNCLLWSINQTCSDDDDNDNDDEYDDVDDD